MLAFLGEWVRCRKMSFELVKIANDDEVGFEVRYIPCCVC
jgi:hypothetical protein